MYREPKNWNEMLEKRIISENMLGEAVSSVNRRARNVNTWEDRANHTDKSMEDIFAEANSYYEKKEKLLSIADPVCIHRAHDPKRTKMYFDDEENFFDNLAHFLFAGLIVGGGQYVRRDGENIPFDWLWGDDEQVVPGEKVGVYFETPSMDNSGCEYYLYYCVGTHGAHIEIDESEVPEYEKKYGISVEDIAIINNTVQHKADLAPMEFVDALIELIDSGDFEFRKDTFWRDADWYVADYRPGVDGVNVFENIRNAFDGDWGAVLAEKLCPAILEKLHAESLSVSRNETERMSWENREMEHMRGDARKKIGRLKSRFESAANLAASAKTAADIEKAKQSIEDILDRLEYAPDRIKRQDHFPDIVMVERELNMYTDIPLDVANVQEAADYFADRIEENDTLLPHEVNKICDDCYDAKNREVWEKQAAPLKKKCENLIRNINARMRKLEK